jgi:hypothetical protein
MFKKRGQITVFIIIGIVLLLIVALFLYIRSVAVERVPTAPAVEEIPTELNPIRTYVQNCLKDTVIDGFELLGARAGYISPENYGITATPFPTDANAVSFFPDDPNSPPVAYWYYFSSRNTCLENCRCDSKQPPLCKSGRSDCFSRGENSIEEQLEEYIKEALNFCTRDFEPFIAQGFEIKEAGEIEPEVTITKNEVNVYLKYPLETRKAEVKQRIPDFYVEFPFNFMKIYEFSSQITKAKRLYFFFERWTMDMINGLGGLNSEIPKTYSIDFSPGTSSIWSKSTVKDHLTNNILPGYTSILRVYNTQNFEPMVFPNEIATGIYRFRDLPVGTTQDFSFSDLKVNFHYFPFWPIYFDISGRGVQGEIIGPEQASGFEEFFSWLGLKRYQYYYDVSFPVIVEITDQTQKTKELFGENGYKFQFALEANIRDNKELNCTGPGLDFTSPPISSLLCGQLHFKSGDIVIETKDKKTNEPLPDVAVIYQCGTETGCDIGYTKIETNASSPYYGKAVLATKLPYPCAGGYIMAKKDKYFLDPIQYNTAPKQDDKLVIELEPIRRVNAIAVKKRIIKHQKGWMSAPGFGAILPNEKVMISLERIKPNYAAEDFTAVVSIEGTAPSEIDLIPGDYKISGILIYDLPALDRTSIIFKDEEVCPGLEVAGICTVDMQTLHMEPFTESFMEGGIELDKITIPSSYLDDYDTISFKVVSIPDSSSFNKLSFSDIEQMGKHAEWSQALKDELNPEVNVPTYNYISLTPEQNPLIE